jgi:uncharacterized membrane protein YkvA (DUF1232 family)
VTLWHVAIGVVIGIVLLWVALVVVLFLLARREDDPTTLRDVLRLGPDVVRLVRRLAADPELPRGVRWRLGALLVYLVLPIDLIPDFIPVVGYADDALILALTLRSVVRAAGPEAIERHWPGTPQGLAALRRLVRM